MLLSNYVYLCFYIINYILMNEEKMFKKGNKITTNRLNCFEILAVNESDISCVDLLSGDFSIFTKTEHTFELFDIKIVLNYSIKEMIDEVDISEKDREHLLHQIEKRISCWL